MNTNLLRMSAMAALAFAAGAASAQSSVTVYGRLNVTGERQKIGTLKAKYVEQNNSSRIGFKGSEDLGGGLRAGFQLEHGFSVDTGAQSQTNFWARQSEVNLATPAGTVRLGTFTSDAYYATADYVSNHNHDTGTSSDALYAYLGRNSNKVGYRAPEFVKDLSVEGSVSASEGAAANGVRQEKNYDLAVNYAIGGLALGLGAEQANNSAVKKSQVAVRALYSAGPVTFGGYVQRDKNAYATGNRTNVRLSGMYTLGASEFHLNAGFAGKTGNVAASKAQQYTVAYNYNLSKRTKVYAFYTKVDDSRAGLYGGDFSSIAFGLRHNF